MLAENQCDPSKGGGQERVFAFNLGVYKESVVVSNITVSCQPCLCWPGRKGVLYLQMISLPANSAPGVFTQVSVEEAGKEGAEPSGLCDGRDKFYIVFRLVLKWTQVLP